MRDVSRGRDWRKLTTTRGIREIRKKNKITPLLLSFTKIKYSIDVTANSLKNSLEVRATFRISYKVIEYAILKKKNYPSLFSLITKSITARKAMLTVRVVCAVSINACAHPLYREAEF